MYGYGMILWELLTRDELFGGMPHMNEIERLVSSGRRPMLPNDVTTKQFQVDRLSATVSDIGLSLWCLTFIFELGFTRLVNREIIDLSIMMLECCGGI